MKKSAYFEIYICDPSGAKKRFKSQRGIKTSKCASEFERANHPRSNALSIMSVVYLEPKIDITEKR